MKKLFLLFAVSLLVSCNNTAVQKVVSSLSPDAEIIEVEANTPAGYLSTANGKVNAFDGDPSNLELWDKYIDAHNNKDLAVIREMNADSTQQFGGFKVYDSAGGVVDGVDSHIERIGGWFEAENPQWETFFSYTMKVDGQIGEWVISGHRLTTTVDGKEKVSVDLADAYIEDGKIGAFWIYSRVPPPPAE
jgi:hypothetical protein|tara:strand:+ start:1589 stop:2158 length:570 start_codon:yes stop_codon:yes gene_type:complete